ncbi:MAG TPA: YidC/Oxa1 family insertase periplasmic-domain containing protein [Planctomycetota bacterium]|jgi:YidC/Oxa1 family membrane protein insertase|nr:YidC/Oxa1 family insertase periplasmic-domain containing protein [Planctomycetota bacterium]
MDRRASLAFFLFMLVAVAYLTMKQVLFPRAAAAPVNAVAPPAPETAPNAAAAAPTPSAAAPAAVPVTSFPATRDVARVDDLVVDTDVFRVRLSNHGAGIRELRLKKYFTRVGIAGDPAQEADPAHWLPLCNDLDPELPLLRLARDPAMAPAGLPPETSNWTSEVKRVTGGTDVVFTFEDGDGNRFEKTLRFRDGRYDVGVELRFSSQREGAEQGSSSYLLTAVSNIDDVRVTKFTEKPAAVFTARDENEIESLPASALKDPQTRDVVRDDAAPFVGATNNYFAFALRPRPDTKDCFARATASKVFDRINFEAALKAKEAETAAPLAAGDVQALHDEWDSNVRVDGMLRVVFPAKGAPPRVMNFDLFAGMRSPDVMEGDELSDFRVLYAVQYGKVWLRWINRVLLVWMRWMHALTHNWGVAIILLTVTVKALLFPLNRMQSRTMEVFQKKMKLLQPQIDELKQRYKNNLQKLQQEQQKLMAANGVRPPVFGCLILFLQMPVWYGLFQIMRTAPDLRQAGFVGWITDLSLPDVVPLPFSVPWLGNTIHLLPILMMVAWLVQNRMMPKATDPQQAQMQKMMNFFPIIFGFFLYAYASGQSLYMLVNSILGMLQMKFLRVTPTS